MKKKLIVVLSGGAIKDEKTGKWRTTKFDDKGDNFGVQGDYLRTIAGSYLYKAKPDSTLIASGGRGQLKNIPGAPTLAAILKSELMNLGVPSKKIIKEEKSGSTYGQLKIIGKMKIEHKSDEVIFISNKWHLPRIKAMISYAPGLEKEIKKAKLIAAEEVVLKYDRQRWQPIISQAYKSKAIKKRIALEKQGVKQVKEGTYKFR